jgi:hypothetical protein
MKTINNTKKIIIAASISLLLILAVLFISFALPFLTASKMLKIRKEAFEQLSGGTTLQINDPYNADGSVLPTTVDVFLDGKEAELIAAELCEAIQNAKYSDKQTNIHGFWDVSISIRSDSKISTIYLCENEIYLTQDASKYTFKLEGNGIYSAFYKKICNMIYEKANSTH